MADYVYEPLSNTYNPIFTDSTGVTDQRSILQACINAAALTGGTIRIPQGTYYLRLATSFGQLWSGPGLPAGIPPVTYACLLKSGITLQGDPGAVLLLNQVNNVHGYNYLFMIEPDAQNISIKNLTFDGSKTSYTVEDNQGFFMGKIATNTRFVNCKFQNCSGKAINFYGHPYGTTRSRFVYVDNCYFTALAGQALTATSFDNITYTNNIHYQSLNWFDADGDVPDSGGGAEAIILHGGNHLIFTDNQFYNWGTSIKLDTNDYGGYSHVTISNNDLGNNPMALHDTRYAVVDNNYHDNAGGRDNDFGLFYMRDSQFSNNTYFGSSVAETAFGSNVGYFTAHMDNVSFFNNSFWVNGCTSLLVQINSNSLLPCTVSNINGDCTLRLVNKFNTINSINTAFTEYRIITDCSVYGGSPTNTSTSPPILIDRCADLRFYDLKLSGAAASCLINLDSISSPENNNISFYNSVFTLTGTAANIIRTTSSTNTLISGCRGYHGVTTPAFITGATATVTITGSTLAISA